VSVGVKREEMNRVKRNAYLVGRAPIDPDNVRITRGVDFTFIGGDEYAHQFLLETNNQLRKKLGPRHLAETVREDVEVALMRAHGVMGDPPDDNDS